MNDLSEGVRVETVVILDGGKLVAGANGVKAMTVSMQVGQGGMIPWIRVETDDDRGDGFLNCAHLQSVRLEPKKYQD